MARNEHGTTHNNSTKTHKINNNFNYFPPSTISSKNHSNSNSTSNLSNSMQRTQSLNSYEDTLQKQQQHSRQRRSKSKPRTIHEETKNQTSENNKTSFRLRSRAKSQTDLRKSSKAATFQKPAPVYIEPDYERISRNGIIRTTQIENYGPTQYSTSTLPRKITTATTSSDRNHKFRDRWRKPSIEKEEEQPQKTCNKNVNRCAKDIQKTSNSNNPNPNKSSNSNNHPKTSSNYYQTAYNRAKTTSVDIETTSSAYSISSSASRQIYVKPPEKEYFEKMLEKEDKLETRRARRKSKERNSERNKEQHLQNISKNHKNNKISISEKEDLTNFYKDISKKEEDFSNLVRSRDRTRAKSTNSVQKFASRHCEKIYQLSKPTPAPKTPESTRSVRRRILSTENAFTSTKLSTLDSFSSADFKESKRSSEKQQQQRLPGLQREFSHLASHLVMHRTTSSPVINRDKTKTKNNNSTNHSILKKKGSEAISEERKTSEESSSIEEVIISSSISKDDSNSKSSSSMSLDDSGQGSSNSSDEKSSSTDEAVSGDRSSSCDAVVKNDDEKHVDKSKIKLMLLSSKARDTAVRYD